MPAVDLCHETAPHAPSRWRARTTRALLTVAGATGAWIILGSTAASAADAPVNNGILDGLTATVQTVTTPVNAVATKAVAPVAAAVAPVAAPVKAVVTTVVTPVVQPVSQVVAPDVQPVAQVVAPVVAPVAQAAAPVVKAVAPAIKATADAVAPAIKPVLDAAAPMLDTVQPVLDAVQPIVDAVQPVIDSLDPEIDAIGTVIDSLDPVVDSLHPVVDPPVEIDVPDIDSAALSGSPLPTVDSRGAGSQQTLMTSTRTASNTAGRVAIAPIASTQAVGSTPAPTPLERTPATDSPLGSTTSSTQNSAPSGVLEYADAEQLTAVKVVVQHSSSLVAGPALEPGNSPD